MQLFNKNLNDDLVVIAEIGVNHEGNPDVALELLARATEAGADAIKLQTYTPERYVTSDDRERLERVRRFALPEADLVRMAARAKALNVGFISTPLSEDVVPVLAALCPVFKIASGDIDFEPVIRAAAATGKPLILSTGLATLEEIDRAVAWVGDESGLSDLRDRLVLLHCVSAYPTPIEQANVRAVPFLAERYGLHVGYSNHVIGDEACLAAVALGASVVEVHVTDCKEGREFRDHALSMDPADLAAFVAKAKRVRAALGSFGKAVQDCEAGVRMALRKGLVAACDLQAGTVLAREHLMYARPATEFAAADLPAVIGLTLDRPLKRGQLLPRDALRAI